MPTTTTQVRLTRHETGTRMEIRAVFDTREQMEQLAKMGMEEGLTHEHELLVKLV